MAMAAAKHADSFFETPLADADPEVFDAIRKELGRQRHEIELIASENIVSRAVLEAAAHPLLGAITRDGTVWISWPKKASKVATDITEDVIREVALPMGLVDTKVCAVDEVWSALKLVIRKELR